MKIDAIMIVFVCVSPSHALLTKVCFYNHIILLLGIHVA